MASAFRLFTAAPARIMATGCPLLLRPLSLLTARVSVKQRRASGTMAARQRARLPPTRTLNRGHVGLVVEGTIEGEGEGVAPQHPGLLGGVAWCRLGGHSSDRWNEIQKVKPFPEIGGPS